MGGTGRRGENSEGEREGRRLGKEGGRGVEERGGRERERGREGERTERQRTVLLSLEGGLGAWGKWDPPRAAHQKSTGPHRVPPEEAEDPGSDPCPATSQLCGPAMTSLL